MVEFLGVPTAIYKRGLCETEVQLQREPPVVTSDREVKFVE